MTKKEMRLWRRALVEVFCGLPVSLRDEDIDDKVTIANWASEITKELRRTQVDKETK